MSSSVESLIKAQCDYCGKPNPEEAHYCSGCGTKLAQEPARKMAERKTRESKPKPLSTGVLLVILFGPLGLLYIERLVAVGLFVAAIVFAFATRRPVLVGLATRIVCVTYVYSVLGKRTKKQADALQDPDGQVSLNEAAKLESTDRVKAIEAYQNVIRLFPETPAAREAAANIETLRRNAPLVDAYNSAAADTHGYDERKF